MALRIANHVDDSRVDRVRGPDVLVVDDVGPAECVCEGTRGDEVRADEHRCGPRHVDDEQAEQRLAPGEAGPEVGRHGRRYLGSRINFCREVHGPSLRVPQRTPVERSFARDGTESVRLASVHGTTRGPLRVDCHPAYRIFLHFSPPEHATQICGLNRRSVIEFITTDTELKPIAAPAMIGFSTIPIPAKTPAAIGMSAVL